MSAGRARGGVRRRPRAPRAFASGLLLASIASACTSGAASVPPDRTSGSPAASGAGTTPGTDHTTAPSASGGGTTTPSPSGGGTTTPIDPATCPVPATAAPPADRPDYTMRLRLDPVLGTVTGTLRVAFTADVATDRLVFRMWPNGPRQAGEGALLTAGPVTSGGERLPTGQPDPTTLVVHPPSPLAAGESITVSMPFRLQTPGGVLDRIGHDRGTMWLGSFFPILAWEPGAGWATDPPTTSLAEASTSTTSDYHVTIDAPQGAAVFASGVRAGDRWTALDVRDFAVGVGRFTSATTTVRAPNAVRVTVGVEDGLRITPQDAVGRVARDLALVSKLYGTYPWPQLHLVITRDIGRAGIEYPTMIFEGAASFALTVSHEVSHQWFYSLVGDDQARDPWLDEALATWAAANVSNYLGYMRSQTAHGLELSHVAYPMTYWDRHQDDYGEGVYWRGAQALDALGPVDAVNCALRRYVAEYAYRIATTPDLIASLAEVFPDAPKVLAPFGIPAKG
ncbi:MAG TPA: M1 family aminopeptidase [Actinomycetota bacterium]